MPNHGLELLASYIELKDLKLAVCTMNLFYIIIIQLLLFFVRSSWQTCSLQPPPLVENPKLKPPVRAAPLSGHIIMPYYNFTCYGFITSWEANITGRMGQESEIRFQVWQSMTKSDKKTTYRLIGENYITQIQPPFDKISYKVPPLIQIEVSPGDIVGIFIRGGDTKIRTEASLDVLTFTANVESPLENFEEPFSNPPFGSRLMVAPQLTIQVIEGTV